MAELSGLIESKFKAARVAMRNEMAQAKDASDLDFVEGLGDATGGHVNDLYIEADPITTFCSCVKTGFLVIQHAIPTGTVMKPPNPIIASIFSLLII